MVPMSTDKMPGTVQGVLEEVTTHPKHESWAYSLHLYNKRKMKAQVPQATRLIRTLESHQLNPGVPGLSASLLHCLPGTLAPQAHKLESEAGVKH